MISQTAAAQIKVLCMLAVLTKLFPEWSKTQSHISPKLETESLFILFQLIVIYQFTFFFFFIWIFPKNITAEQFLRKNKRSNQTSFFLVKKIVLKDYHNHLGLMSSAT